MGGGLLQLVAYGAQDVSLTGNPQITFFKTVFRRHTHFAKETVEQTINGDFKAGGRLSFTISRDGDLLSNIILKTDGSTSDSFQCIDYIECEIGGQLIDKQYSHWMNLWCDLTHGIDKTKQLNDLRIGFEKVSTLVTIDENQPSPPELNSIALNQVINYPGTEDSGTTAMVLHSSGRLYFSRATPGGSPSGTTSYKISMISNSINNPTEYTINDNFTPNIHGGYSSRPRKLKIHGNYIYVVDRGLPAAHRVSLDQNGDHVETEDYWIYKYTNNVNGDLMNTLTNLVNGVDTIGYDSGNITDICINSNMMLLSSEGSGKILRVYDNGDQHHSEQVLSPLATPTTEVVNQYNAGNADGVFGVGTIASFWGISAFDGPNVSNPFIIIAQRNHAIRKLDLNTNHLSTIAGLAGTSGNVDGGIGTSRIHDPMGQAISPDGSYILFTGSGAPKPPGASPPGNGGRVKKLDLSTNIVTTLAEIQNPTGIAIHPTLNFAYIVTYPGQLNRLNLSDNTVDLLVGNMGGNGYPLSISPDGTFLLGVVANPWGLKRINLDSNGSISGALQTINVSGGVPSSTFGADIMADSDTVILGNKIFKITNPGSLIHTLTDGVAYGITRTQTMSHAYKLNTNYALTKVNLSQTSTITPNYYFKQHTSQLKDTNNSPEVVWAMEIDDNDNIFVCFKDTPGLYKVTAGSNREDTPCDLIAGSDALIERGEYIFRHTNGDLYISCKLTGRVIKYSGDQFSVAAGKEPERDGNGDPLPRTVINTDDALTSSFVYPFGICITGFNDLIICDRGELINWQSTGNGSVRVIGGYKPVVQGGIVSTPQPAYIPLQFWFCRNPGLALPLIALQYHEVRIIVKLAANLNGVNSLSAWGDYVFLDKDERRRFAQLSHEYLIEQVQYSNRLNISSNTIANNTSQEVISVAELQFNHPVKEIVWTINQSTSNGNNRVNKACSIQNLGGNQNIKVHTAYIQMNGDDRFEKREGKYFSQVQRYQHHTSAGINNTRIGVGSDDVTSDLVKAKWYPKTCNAHIYSFALHPEDHQPSGTCNFSRLDNAIIHNTFNTTSVNGTYHYFLDIYATNYNILNIESGMGGLVYAN